VRFGIVGAGVIGKVHAAAISKLSPEAELAFVADEIRDRAETLAADHGAAAGTSISEILERPDIDAVAICTPSGQHAGQTFAALEAGKHVVVEKPLDVSMAAAAQVAKAQRLSGCTVTVISQHRFDPSSRLVRDSIRGGLLGGITSAVASVAWWRGQDYYDSGNWRGTRALDGGGAVINQGIHTIDLLLWLLGDAAEVFAWAECLAHESIEVEDTAVATIRFASGALGAVHATTAAYPGLTARLQVHGTSGSAVIDGDRLAYFHIDPREASTRADAVSAEAGRLIAAQTGPAAGADPAALSGAHTEQYRDFLDAVAQGRPPAVTVGDAARTLVVVHAIYASARSGRPVRIPVNT
jgi:predicted dehydrogenase